MIKTACIPVYIGKDGKPSLVYSQNLHLGEDVAKRLYLESMAGVANTKFQKNMVIEDLIAESDAIVLSKDEENYTQNEKYLDRSTNFLGRAQQKKEMDEFAAIKVIADYAYILLEKDMNKALKDREYGDLMVKEIFVNGTKDGTFSLGNHLELKEKLMEVSQEFMDNNPDDFEKRKQKLLDLWEFKTEAGTKIHKIMEDYVNARSKVEPDEDNLYDYKKAAEETMIRNGLPKNSNYLELIDQMEKFFVGLEGKGKNKKKLKYHTEVKISDTEIGVAGTLDLLVEDEQGDLYIFDYKTKERGKEHLFAWTDKRLKGVMNELYDNKQTHGALQTSLYRLMLERKGFNVKESKIIYIEADIEYDKKGKVIDYKNFNHLKNVTLDYHRSVLGKYILEYNKDVDIDEEINSLKEPGKFNDAKSIVSDLTGKESLDDTKDVPTLIKNKLAEPSIGPVSKKEGFFNELTNSHEDFRSKDPSARKTQLEEYYMQAPKLAEDTANNVVNWFNGGKKTFPGKGRKNSSQKQAATRQAAALLAGLDESTHSLKQVRNIHGFSHLPPNILIATDKITKASRIINISVRSNGIIKHESSTTKRPRTSIMGKYITDRSLKVEYQKISFIESTDTNYRLFQNALIAAELKKRKYVVSIEALTTGTVNGNVAKGTKSKPPTTRDMQEYSSQLELFHDLIKDEDSYGGYIKTLLEDKDIINAAKYNTNYIDSIGAILDNGLMSMNASNVDKIKQYFVDYDNGAGSLQLSDLIDKLVDRQYDLSVKLGESGTENKEDLAQDKSYEFLSRIILDLMDVHLSIGSASRELSSVFGGYGRTMSKISNDAVEVISNKINESEQFIKRDFEVFRSHHHKVLNKLRDYKGKTKVAGIRDEENIFHNLFKDGGHPDTDNVNPDSLFMLKDADDSSLAPAERDYIIFFNKYMRDGFEMTFNEEQMEGLNAENSSWKKGVVPLIRASLHNKFKRTEGVKEKIASYKDSLNKKNEKRMGLDFEFGKLNTQLKDTFHPQVGNGYQNNKERRDMLGMHGDGSFKEEGDQKYKEYDTNLENILHTFMKDSLRSKHYKSTLGAYNSLNVIMTIDENRYFNQNKKTREFADAAVKLQVFGEYANEGPIAKKVDKGQKVLTAAALGASVRQILLEGTTNIFGSASAVIQQAMTSNGEDKRFTVRNWHRAMKATLQSGHKDSNKANKLVRDLGLFNADSETLASSELQETRKNGLFQSKWLYALNNLPYRFFKTNTALATLMTSGAYDGYEFDAESNELVYDVARDKRFASLFNNDGSIKNKSTFDAAQKKSWSLLKLRIKEFSKEYDGLKSSGTSVELEGINYFMPNRGVTINELADVKDYSLRLYGSMDKDAKPAGSAYVAGRVILKFKNWAVAKKDNYWKKGKYHDQRGTYKWTEDAEHEDGGYYNWEPDWDEGIIQTLGHLNRGLREAFGRDNDVTMKSLWSDMSRKQKENIRKVIADIIVVGIIYGLMAALFDDDEKEKGPMSLLYKATNSAVADLNVFQMSDSMMGNSPVAMYGQATRTLGSIWNMTCYMTTGDFGLAMKSAAGTTGFGKSTKALVE
jgi:hypothetical protein